MANAKLIAARRDEHRAQAQASAMARAEKAPLFYEERNLISSWSWKEWAMFFAAVAIATVLVGFIGPSELESQQGVVNVMRAATGVCK